jgi:peptide/nickel transport system permease protein
MFSWARIAKVVRAKVLSIRRRDYIIQSKLYGAKFSHIFHFHMKGEVLPIVIINSVGVIGRAIIQESSLAYLGLCDPTSRSWGLMISKVLDFPNVYYTEYWKWWLISPLLSLVLTILMFRALVRELEKNWLDEADHKKIGGKPNE